jgi:hypothetical protein
MEPITLITTALAFATPYLIKTGEAIAEKVGEDIWNVIKKPFQKDKSTISKFDINNPEEKERLVESLIEFMRNNPNYKTELESAVVIGERELKGLQQNIYNEGQIEKQINIQNNTGNIQM